MNTATATRSATYTALDVENVVRRVKADLTMIADSTGAWTAAKVAEYAHDVEQLAKKGYLARVDVTLFSGSTEIKAVQFDVDTEAGSLTSARPGGVLWPKVADAHLRIVLSYTSAYDADARRTMKDRLKIGWTPTDADTSHASLSGGGGRDYASNAFGMKRKDWTNWMADTSIFDSETLVPDAGLAARAPTLLGFDRRYDRVHGQLRLLLNADALGDWNKRHHGGKLVIAERVADQYPLIVFHGDVGTGKTVTAECVANRLMTDAGMEDCTLFKLSNRVRGGGLVGEMGSLLSEAFKRITAAVGKHRRAVLIIDEGDSIAATRTQDHSHHEDKVAVNTLIQGIDDLRRFKGRIAVILCTNRLSVLDPALLRRAAIVEGFDRPTEEERRELLAMDLDGFGLTKPQLAELVALSGPRDDGPGWTFSDFRTRFYPSAVAMAFPDAALGFGHLREAAKAMTASRVMEDR